MGLGLEDYLEGGVGQGRDESGGMVNHEPVLRRGLDLEGYGGGGG